MKCPAGEEVCAAGAAGVAVLLLLAEPLRHGFFDVPLVRARAR
jgi:hypothetical protein